MGNLFFVLLLGTTIAFIFLGLKIVPQGQEWVVERLGKFNAILEPGLNIIIPFVDSVRYKITTKDIILEIPQQEVITKDNAVILANAIAFIKVTNIERAVYGVENFSVAMKNMVQTSLRSIIGGLELNQALSSRDLIKSQLKSAISDEAGDWGLTVKTVEIQDIRPSQNMQKSMEMQAGAEKEKIAVITRAEGQKQSTIIEAEAKMEAAKIEAEAQLITAEANAKSISIISQALKDNQAGATFILGERYIDSLRDLAISDNSKTVVMPADITTAIKSFMGK